MNKDLASAIIQKSLNSTNINFQDIVDNLNRYAEEHSDELDKRQLTIDAQRLSEELSKQLILVNEDSYEDKFESLGNFGIDDVKDVVRLCDDIIKDVKHARKWINMYYDFARKFTSLDDLLNPEISHKNIVNLGKAILARAIELCPMDTGNLRRSGIMVETKDSVIIAFACDYASYVHEDLNNHHDVGRAKFLEIALQETFPERYIWVEIHGYKGISVTLSVNKPFIEYKHYD